MTPTSRPGLGRSANLRPWIVAAPEVGRVRPTMMRIEVDFPAPFGPRKPVTRPARAVKLMSSTTVRAPYFLESDSTVIMGNAPGLRWCFDARSAARPARRRQVAFVVRPRHDLGYDLGRTRAARRVRLAARVRRVSSRRL